MKILISLFIVALVSNAKAECNFRPEIKKVISLSGTTTVLLKELGLLNHPKLEGISIFNPILENEFKGRVYPGGIFLSQSTFSHLSNAVILFDESRELKKILHSQKINSRELKTRNLSPGHAVKAGLSVVKELIVGCELKFREIGKKVTNLESKIISLIKNNPTIIFYLGALKPERAPEMLMVNDGVVKWLVEERHIKTYPSELAYVNWSAKIIHSLPKDSLHVGVVDSGRRANREVKKRDGRINLSYPGSLVPGLTQLEAFQYLFENI